MAQAAKTKRGFTSRARTKKPEGAHNITPVSPISIHLPRGPGGVPTTYCDEYADQAIHLCALGATDSDLALAFEVTPETVAVWRAKYPKFAEALKIGKSACDDRVERSLYMNAVGYDYDAIEPMVVDKQIVDHPVRKRVLPNTAAQIFWLKNRRKDIWRDVHQLEHGRPGEFAELDDRQLAERMAQAARDLKQLESELAAKENKPNKKGKKP